MNKSLLFFIAICGALFICGCAAGNTTTTPPPVATHFSVTPATLSPIAGTTFNFAVTALDGSGQIVTGYSGTVHFTSTDTQAALPPASTLTNGTGTFRATLKTAAPQTITATDSSSLSGISSPIPVNASAATRLSITVPTAASTGLPFSCTVTAFDTYNNIATGYSGTVRFSSVDSQAVLPANSLLGNGSGTFRVTLKTVGNETITATDTAAAMLTIESSQIGVVSNAPTHFAVASSGNATTRASFGFGVAAQDSLNNVSVGYSGTIHFTSTDSQAHLPADASLSNGTGNFSATFETAGNQFITSTDTVTSSLTGASSSITVSAATAPRISSGAPPAGNYGAIYGPLTLEYIRCGFIQGVIHCSPCSGSAGCSALPVCTYRNRVYPCVETSHIYLGFPLTATGGVPPYTWSATGLPPGLGLTVPSGNGYIFGHPTMPGSYAVAVTVTDSGTPQVTSPAGNYTLVINNPKPPVINTVPVPSDGAVNMPYDFTFTAASAAPPLTWRTSPSSGALPVGLTLSPSGVLSGTPTASGTSPITLIAEDSFTQDSAPQNFTISIFAHGFKVEGMMATPRVSFTATLLNTGKVLVAGGSDAGGNRLATAELYDPANGTFSATGSMGTARAYFAATLLCNLSSPPCNDNRVLVTGGIDINGKPLMTAELYDPASGTFSATSGNMQFVHASHTATLLKTGKVLIAGWGNASAELFDPSTNTFTATGSMATGRVSHTATLLNDGKVLIAGGIQGVPPTTTVLAEAELYDPASGSFSPTLGSMATPRQWHTATLLAGGKVLVTGGADSTGSAFATAELFDPIAESFTPTKGGMATARGLQTATLLNAGTVLVTGGTSGVTPLATAELYDPIAETFSPTGGMRVARQEHTATLLNDGTVMVTGGANSAAILTTAEVYQ